MTEIRNWLLVSETFYSFQGEGPSTGQRAWFLRLGPCDLTCKWCDTSYTWAFSERKAAKHESHTTYDASKELNRRTIPQLVHDYEKDGRAPLVVITGGEPMLQVETVSRYISALNELVKGPRVEIETAGHHAPGDLFMYPNVRFNVSPKLSGSGNSHEARYKPEVLKQLAAWPGTAFKFVVDTRSGTPTRVLDSEIAEVNRIVNALKIDHNHVWLMPCGTETSEVIFGLQKLAPIALNNGYNLTGRQHVEIWGNKRGH